MRIHDFHGFVPKEASAAAVWLLSSVLRFKSLLTTFLILSAQDTIVQWVRDICPSFPLPSRSSSWRICSCNHLCSQVLNLGSSPSLSSPAWSYWECFQRTFIVCDEFFFLPQSLNFASRISFLLLSILFVPEWTRLSLNSPWNPIQNPVSSAALVLAVKSPCNPLLLITRCNPLACSLLVGISFQPELRFYRGPLLFAGDRCLSMWGGQVSEECFCLVFPIVLALVTSHQVLAAHAFW